MKPEDLNAKISLLEQMLDKLSGAVEEGNAVLNLPPAEGLIADCQKGCIEIVSQIAEAASEAGFPVWLDGRSLLAASRTQTLLPWETSAEIGTTEECLRLISAKCPELRVKERTVSPVRRPAYGRMCPEVKVLVWSLKDGTASLDGSEDVQVPESQILPLGTCILNGADLPRPAKAWKLLEAEFGEGWKTML